ncbi:hypothetical protein GCM10010280_66070 [Streptomyces pilosus]|uniref:Uncharacterized protein n=1 Tax=Streptomyces pilosus TaxID=28893 RepID=A0A918C7T1_9ACTN|nr:hypothetical protein GCM10010280_66070 [Streptomyces pilosus]
MVAVHGSHVGENVVVGHFQQMVVAVRAAVAQAAGPALAFRTDAGCEHVGNAVGNKATDVWW